MALVRAENKLGKASDRIMALEESLHGKEDAIARLLEENEQLRADLAVKGTIEVGVITFYSHILKSAILLTVIAVWRFKLIQF